MVWSVLLGDEFKPEFAALAADVQDEALAVIELLRENGPQLGRPHADTLKGSSHANMKELRFSAADGVWRIAFAFDPGARRSCWSRATSLGAQKNGFTGS